MWPSSDKYTYEVAQIEPETTLSDGQAEEETTDSLSEPNELEEEGQEEAEVTLLPLQYPREQRWKVSSEELMRWLIIPLPSFMHRFFIKTEVEKESRRQTDYLDGIRGVASLFVFFDHYIDGLHPGMMSHGFGDADDNWSFFQLPFIKTIYAGSAMVAIFFVVSGYVLSRRCIVYMRSREFDKLGSTLTSMTFRRGIRLFLPSIVISLTALLCVLLGVIRPEESQQNWTPAFELQRYWRYLNDDLIKLWTWEVSYRGWYSPQLWTISLEFKCSMVLFLVILFVSKCRAAARIMVYTGLLLYLFYDKRWDVALFVAGMAIAEVDVIFQERKERLPTQITPEKTFASHSLTTFLQNMSTPVLWLLLVLGLYLSGYPSEDAPHTPGYGFLASLWIESDWEYKWRFWLSQSAILIVFSVSFLPTCQAFFTTSIARYLGKISYSLYLVHGLMGMTVRLWLWHLFWNVLEYRSEEGYNVKFEGGWILGTVLYLPLVFWTADLFSRGVDIPIVKFAKWLEIRCFVPSKGA